MAANILKNPGQTFPLVGGATNILKQTPLGGAVSGIFHGGGHHTQWQNGNDNFFNSGSPEDIALKLGQDGYRPGYDSNSQGSYEGSYNKILNGISPDLLVKRYAQGNAGQFNQTPQDQLNYQAFQAFKSALGRDPTANEFSQILPSFQGPNGLIGGRAAVVQLQQQYKLNPTLDPTSAQNKLGSTDFTKQVNDTFQSVYGRAANPEEAAHFQQLMQSGQLDSYTLAGQLKQLPEYTNAQDQQFRTGLNDQLSNYDAYAFNKMGAPQIFSQYAQNGMPTGSSPSLNYALTDLMGRMAQNRSQYMAQLSASQYGGNKDLATQNYQQNSNQFMNNWSNNLGRSQQMGDMLTQRGYNGMDYQTMMNDAINYNNKMNRQPNNFMNYVNTGLNAINTGANLFRGMSNPFSQFSSSPSYGGVGGNMGLMS